MSLTTSTTSTAQAQSRTRLPATFRSLRHRNYRLWFIGQTISLVGTWMQTMAQQVLVYRLTGSAAALGLVNFIGLIPVIPLSLWGGSISDRIPKRTIIISAQAVMMVQAFLIAALTWTDSIQLWHVYLLSFFLGAANAVDLPARQAFTVDMVEGKDDLTNAIGLNSAMFNGARAVGPALAGLVVAATGEGPAFLFNGLSFLAVIISLLMMRNLPEPAHPSATRVSVAAHTLEGMRFVFRQRLILVLVSLVGVSAFLSMPYNTLMPVFAGDILGQSAQPVVDLLCSRLIPCQSPEALPLGLLLTIMGVGAVIGALLVASMPDSTRRGRYLTIGNLGFPLLLFLLAGSRSFILSLLLMLLIGFSFVMQNAMANTLLQILSPDEMRGRVMSFYTLTFQTMMRLGGLQAGFTADRFGAPVAVGVGALASLVYGLFVAIRYPRLRKS